MFPSLPPCQTLRRKGLGLEGSELDSEESMQVAPDKYPLSEGMDLSVARQRFYVSSHTHTHPGLSSNQHYCYYYYYYRHTEQLKTHNIFTVAHS